MLLEWKLAQSLTDKLNASSQYSIYHAPTHGRLNGQDIPSGKKGAWSPATSDANQWLQIDLGRNDITVTRVGTQGRNGYRLQCVTEIQLAVQWRWGQFSVFQGTRASYREGKLDFNHQKVAKYSWLFLKRNIILKEKKNFSLFWWCWYWIPCSVQ